MPTRRRRLFLIPVFLVLPLLAIFLVFYLPPIAYTFIQSFYKFSPMKGIIKEWHLGNYGKFLTDSYYLGILWRTIWLSAVVALVCLVLGYPVAYYILHMAGRARGLLVLLILSPLLVTVVIRSLGWIILLAPTGPLNRAVMGLHITSKPLPILFQESGVIIGLAHIYFAFMVLSLISSLQRIDPSLPLAARNLGANTVQAFLRVTLPLSLPGVLAGSVLVFVLSVGSFVIPAMLGGGKVTVLTYLIYQQYIKFVNWPFGNAMAFILLVLASGIILLAGRWLERGKYSAVFQ
ncbi:MAG: ABC transporter permease [Chloroflexi bacterium]|nr:ABC transporter permease [Chloroflexota bacterium]